MRMAFPYDLTPQPDGGWTIVFPDIPEAITQADAAQDIAAMAEDALVTALSFYTDARQAIPRASTPHGRPVAEVPALVAAKLALHDAMLKAGLSNVDLAERLGIDEKAVRRLRDPLHRSHIGQVDAALRTLGKRVSVSVLEA